jgi:hypothetical protein
MGSLQQVTLCIGGASDQDKWRRIGPVCPQPCIALEKARDILPGFERADEEK